MNSHGLLLAIFVLVFGSTYVFSAPHYVTIALGEWPPYASESLPHKGLLPLILKKTFAYSNTKVKFEFMNWDEAYDKTRDGEFDISPGWLKNPTREKEVSFSDAMAFIDLRFLHRSSDNFSWNTLEETYTYKLGTVSGYSYGAKLDSAIKDKHLKTHQYKSDRQALIGIAKKEIDLYPADALLANYTLNKLPSSLHTQIAVDEQTILSNPIFLISKPDSTNDIIKKFNLGLKQLRESGEYSKILENFHLINKLGNLNFYTEDNAPITYKGENGPTGIMVSSIRSLLSELGADLGMMNIQILPWARAYQNLEQKNNTVLFAVTKTEQRANKFKWVGPVYRSNIVLLGLEKNFTDEITIDALLEKNVCAVKNDVGAQLWQEISSYMDRIHLVSHPSQCAKMVSLGRVDLWATGKDTAHWHIKKNQLELSQFKEVYQLKEAFRFIAFSQDVDNEIIDSLQKKLGYLQLSGKLNQLIQDELAKADRFAKSMN